jgi:transcriptional regulator with XRE-family HTH domain
MSEDRLKGLIKIGLRIREKRKLCGLSLEDVARRAGVTASLMSKFENFRAIPSLPVLVRISSALNIDMAELVRGIGDNDEEESYCLIKSADREPLERDNAVGFLYELITSRRLGDYIFDAIVLTLEPNSHRKAVTTEGYEFVYILDGQTNFHIGNEVLKLKQGDAVFFNGRIPHLPKNTTAGQTKMLAVYLIENALK